MPDATIIESRSLFVTGATGFIGRALLDSITSDAATVTCLSRRPPSAISTGSGRARCRWITGDVDRPSTYSAELAGIDTVIHLAAATGNAHPAEMRRVNVAGTQRLLEECRRRRVRHFLYVSSIAASFRDLQHYPYGQTKLEAETAVRSSGVDFTILRPTMVLGRDSPIWLALRKLACLPVVPVFGDGTQRVQPIAVTDVVRAIVAIVTSRRFHGETLELGGPDIVSWTDFLMQIRRAHGLRGTYRIHCPLRIARAVLRIPGCLTPGRTPVSAGQLEPFVNDGTADAGDLQSELRGSMLPLDLLLRGLVDPQPDAARIQPAVANK